MTLLTIIPPKTYRILSKKFESNHGWIKKYSDTKT